MSNKVNITAGLFTAFAYESITVSTSAVGLNSYTHPNGELAKRVLITVENAQLRYRYDGGNPSSSEGHNLNPMDVLTLVGSDNIKNFKAIRKGSVDAKIYITYEL